MLLAERIREELERTVFDTPLGPLSVTCSLGVATFPDAGADWDTLFKAADTALYESKHGGRNRVTLHAPRRRSERVAKSAQPHPSGPRLSIPVSVTSRALPGPSTRRSGGR